MAGSIRKVSRGDIYWMDWYPARGSEQEGHRPGLVIQSNKLNHYYSLTIVVAISRKGFSIPCHVKIPPTRSNGLPETSYVRCEQLMTASQLRLEDCIGRLEEQYMEQVDEALKLVLGIY